MWGWLVCTEMVAFCPCTKGLGLPLSVTVQFLQPPPPPPPPQFEVQGVAVGVSVGVGAVVVVGSGVPEVVRVGSSGIGLGEGRLTVAMGKVATPFTSRPWEGACACPLFEPPKPSAPMTEPVVAVSAPTHEQMTSRTTKPSTPDIAARYCGFVSQRCWKRSRRSLSQVLRVIPVPVPHSNHSPPTRLRDPPVP